MKQDRPPFDRRWLPLNALRAFAERAAKAPMLFAADPPTAA